MEGNARVLFVPSCGVTEHNVLTPTDTLLRCEEGLKLWRSGDYDYILVTGGLFNPKHVQSIPAGMLMRGWFIARGVDPNKVIEETRSLDTFENIKFGLEELRKRGIPDRDITVVTQWQHAWRFAITFRRAYGIKVKRVPLEYAMSWKSWLIEFVLIAYHAYDRYGTKHVAQKNRDDRRKDAESE